MKRLILVLAVLVMGVAYMAGTSMAYEVPKDDSNVEYFYVFGPDGDPYLGKEDSELTLYVNVPAGEHRDVEISIYDPDTGGKRDFRASSDNPWDTLTEFSVWGKDLLDKKEFAEGDYNQKYFTFGPYSLEQGEKTESGYTFKVEARALKGDDENLFKLAVSPDTAEVFSKNITFRLLQEQGAKMYFYPEISAGTEHIVVENYDLDAEGGESMLYDTALRKRYQVGDSKSGEWRETIVPFSTDTQTRRLEYVITKKYQKYANGGLRVKDDKGNSLPIYFKKKIQMFVAPQKVVKEEASDLKCNKFTFDATKSHDADSKNLSFLWDFGDGTTSTEPVVAHIYEEAGEYIVTLSVTDDSDLACNTSVTSRRVVVNTPPEAVFISPELACIGDEIKLDASQTSDDTPENLSYIWELGDGTIAEGQKISKIWEKGGIYKITLKTDDNMGSECSLDTLQRTIKVNAPPVADAGSDIQRCFSDYKEGYKIKFNASKSKDENRDDLTYTWDFGDGNTETGKEQTHIYKQDGEYEVALTVDDGSKTKCSADLDVVKVNIMSRPFADAGEDLAACAEELVSFNGATSYGASSDDLAYTWDFGDGTTAKGIKTQHAYKDGGRYTATLTVDNVKDTPCSKATDSLFVDVNSRPVVIVKDVDSACAGKNFTFDARDSRDPDGGSLSYLWDFGDGNVSKGRSKISHAYSAGGAYQIQVTADDNKNTSCSTQTASIDALVNTPPVASPNPDHVCCIDDVSEFSGADSYDADGDALTYAWDFGDGTTGSGVKPTHIYVKSGAYKVTLMVADSSGTACGTDASSFKVSVNEKPTSVIKIR